MMRRLRPWFAAVACLMCLMTGALLSAETGHAQSQRGFMAQIDIDGAIGPAAAEYFRNASQRAMDEGARAIVLRLDTPGGLSKSMHDIIADILASPVPVLCFVAPSGARAASAGTYIFYACPVAAMAPATHLGAATPVSLGGGTPMPSPAKSTKKPQEGKAGAEQHKVLNDAIAYIRSLAELHHRNADWAEQAVRGAATLTANEAVEKHVADFI